MDLTLPTLVGTLPGERLEVRLVAPFAGVFVGPSEAELLDDAALHAMEHGPKLAPRDLNRLLLSPDVTLRKVTLDTALRFGNAKKATPVKVKLTAVCTRWAKDRFWMVSLPRVGPGEFALQSLSDVSEGAARWLAQWAKNHHVGMLNAAGALRDAHLELIDVEVELPSVLPSRMPKRKKKKKKTKKPKESTPTKRTWIPAHELRAVAVNLVYRAMDGRLSPALGRDALVEDLVEQLQAEGAAILLVGEPGVGKTAVIEAVAQKLAVQTRTVQERTDVWRVDGSRLIAGMSYVGAWERRMANVVNELFHREDVLVVEDLPSLAWTGRSAHSETTMAGFLLPHLQRGELRILAECTPARLEAGRQKNPGFFSNFRVIHLDAMDPTHTHRVLLQHLREVERVRGVVGSVDLLPTAMSLARRFGPPLAEPGRSVVLLRRFLGEANAESTDSLGRGRLGRTELLTHFGKETGLPRFVLEPGVARKASEIRQSIQRHIVGQEVAVETVVDVVAALQQGLDDPKRPVATLLFVGPTGVGKTETAKALALDLFGSTDRMLRFDMSEVQGPGALRRLVGGAGSPDGELTRAVRNQPFSVVLLDEIEKAGSHVFDLLLQVLGEGRLTNAVGRTTDFRNTVVVMTSNLGVAQARRRAGFASESTGADATHFRRAAREFFRPEFYNRIDHVVPFRALGMADVEPLVQRILGKVLSRRGLRRSGVVVRLDAEFKTWIAEVGFDPLYGARSLQRVVERELTVPLARLLVDEGPTERGAFIDVWRDDSLHLRFDSLRDGAVDAARRPLPGGWPEVAQDHQVLQQRVERIVEHEAWDGLEEERSALLDQVAGGLDEAQWERLNLTTAVIEQRSALTSELEDFAEEWLASFRYEDTYTVLKPGLDRTHRLAQKRRIVTEAVPIPVERGRTLTRASRQLLDLELRTSELVHRVRHAGTDSPFVMVFEPLHREARDFANELLRAFAFAWRSWGWVRAWRRGPEGWEEAEYEAAEALSFQVPGLADLLQPDLGLYLDASDFGASRLLRLVHVQQQQGEAKSALAEWTEAHHAALQARREGAEWQPLPPVVHRFGVLRPKDELAPALATLRADLKRLALRRVEV